jgi:hypothetical protein
METEKKRKQITKKNNPCYVPAYYVSFNVYVYAFKMNPNHLRKEKTNKSSASASTRYEINSSSSWLQNNKLK